METLGHIFLFLLVLTSAVGIIFPWLDTAVEEYPAKNSFRITVLIVLAWMSIGGIYGYHQLLANKPVSPSLELIIPGLGHGPVELDPHGVGRVMIPPQALGIPDVPQEAPQGYQESPKSNGLDKNGHVEGIVRL